MALGDERRALGRANEAARRAIGTNNEAARRATGTNNEAARHAGGAAMVERRRGSTVVEDVNSIITPTRKSGALRTIDPVGAVPARTSPGLPQAYAPAQKGNGGGIASPLVETTKVVAGQTVPDREYFEDVLLPTTDGLIWIKWRGIKKVKMLDANGEPCVMEFKNALA